MPGPHPPTRRHRRRRLRRPRRRPGAGPHTGRGHRRSTAATTTCSSRCSTKSRPRPCRRPTSPGRSGRSSAGRPTPRCRWARSWASTRASREVILEDRRVPLRLSRARHRRPPFLLRHGRVGDVGTGPEEDRRRDPHPRADPAGVRARRGHAGSRRAPAAADLRRRRRRPDRGRDGRVPWRSWRGMRWPPTSAPSTPWTRGWSWSRAAPRVLPAFPHRPSAKARQQLERLGVEVRLGAAGDSAATPMASRSATSGSRAAR